MVVFFVCMMNAVLRPSLHFLSVTPGTSAVTSSFALALRLFSQLFAPAREFLQPVPS